MQKTFYQIYFICKPWGFLLYFYIAWLVLNATWIDEPHQWVLGRCVYCSEFYVILINDITLCQISKNFKYFPNLFIWFTSLFGILNNLNGYSLLLFKIYCFLLMNYCFCIIWKNSFTFQCQNNFYWFHHSSLSLLCLFSLIFYLKFLPVL